MISLLPKLPPHRPSAAVKAAYREKVVAFCDKILEVRSGLDFEVGSRGWAYILEGERFIDKDEIDAAQDLINDCRKSGDLPLDICAEDNKRAAENVEEIDPDPKEMAADIFHYIQTAQLHYTPFSFWDDLDTYVQMATEKSNTKNLFAKPCATDSRSVPRTARLAWRVPSWDRPVEGGRQCKRGRARALLLEWPRCHGRHARRGSRRTLVRRFPRRVVWQRYVRAQVVQYELRAPEPSQRHMGSAAASSRPTLPFESRRAGTRGARWD